MAARYLPSVQLQRRRQQQLPEPAAARAMLEAALAGLPFRSEAFAPFLADLEQARTARPLTEADLAGTPLAARCRACCWMAAITPPRWFR